MNHAHASVMLAAAALFIAAGCASNERTGTCCLSCVPAGDPTAVDETTAGALRAALLDERRVQAFYNGVMAAHGDVRPFSNIVHAEERHADLVESLMSRHGVAIPIGPPTDVPTVPGTLTECNRLAARLERENIAMYDRLLAGVTEPDIRAAFENLRDASKNNHLPAFERWSAGAAPGGRGMGVGYGRRQGGGSAGRGVCLRGL